MTHLGPSANDKHAESLHQTILEHAPAGMAIIDSADLKMKWCNRAFKERLEEPRKGADIIGLHIGEIIPNFPGSRLERLLEKVQKSGNRHTESELEIKGTDQGSSFWRVSLLPFLDDDRERRILMLVIDTTEQVKALRGIEHLLRREEEERIRLRVILDTLPVGVIVSDQKGGFIEVNSMADKIWGGRLPLCTSIDDYAKFSGKRPDTNQRLKPMDWAIARALSAGETILGDAVDIQRFDGREATVLNSAAPIRNAKGGIIGAVQVTQDITERALIETELETARSVLEAVIDQMPAGVAVAKAPSGMLLFGNSELERMFGESLIPSSGIADYYEWNATHPNGAPISRDENAIARSIQKGETVKGMEILLRRADGSQAALNVNSAPIRDRRGRITAGVAVNVDITEKKRAEKDLEQRARELERSNAELEEFAYAASHDLREPLRAISGNLSLLQMKNSGALDDEAKAFIESSIKSAERLNALIEDLLAYSRVGSLGEPFVITDFEHALRSTLEGLKGTIEESHAVITHDPLPSTIADETQIVEVFQNLISNAIKYRGPPAPRIHISSQLISGEYVFSIKDNGIGVANEHKEKIWKMFYRVHAKQDRPGTGMGLCICRKIIERHGGRTWVEDNPEGGSTFKFTIPAKGSDWDANGVNNRPKEGPEARETV